MYPENPTKTREVFGISRDLPMNYVVRKSADENLIANLTRDKHIVIYGSSKQGKTSLRKHCLKRNDYIIVHCSNRWDLGQLHVAILKQAGYDVSQSKTLTTTGRNKVNASAKLSLFGSEIGGGAEDEEVDVVASVRVPLVLDPDDVNEIIEALKHVDRYIVLEDFHYLSVETQKDFAVALKAFHEQSNLCFIIVGVWLEENRLTVYNGDLTGRIVSINADKWMRTELQQVITAGEYLLGIQLDDNFKADLLENCFESVYIVQEACYQCCEQSNIFHKQSHVRIIGADVDAKSIINKVVDQQTARYKSFFHLFSGGFQDTTLHMYKWLLYPVLMAQITDLEKGLHLRDIRQSLKKAHPQGANLNPGNLTQALQYCASLQVEKKIKPIILDYDQTNTILRVVDRSFMIWLSNQNREELLSTYDLLPPVDNSI